VSSKRPRILLACYRLLFALLVAAAVVVQLEHSLRTIASYSVVNFFSFFTIESNVFGLIIFLVTAKTALTGHSNTHLDYMRGAATLYMTVTGIVYSVALAGVNVQTAIPWINAVLHYIFPIVVLLDWIIDRPAKISFKRSLLWLVFPTLYLVYSLIRGAIVHWYPYPFLNAAIHGYLRVALNSLVVALVAVLLTLFLAAIPRLTKERR
jgi:hypothetical protein